MLPQCTYPKSIVPTAFEQIYKKLRGVPQGTYPLG